MARTRSQPVEEAPASGAYPAWARSVAEVESHWHVKVARGLSEAQVTAQRVQFGFNELDKEQSKPLWKLVLEQFDDPLVKVRRGSGRSFRGNLPSLALARAAPTPLPRAAPCSALTHSARFQILLVAACMSLGISWLEEAEGADKLSKFIEPGVIVLILVLNATVGVWMARALPWQRGSTLTRAGPLCRRTTPRAPWMRSRRCRASTPRRCATATWCVLLPSCQLRTWRPEGVWRLRAL